MSKKKVDIATIWLDGCSGCHMSFLDIDEVLLDLVDKINLVYSPLVDFKTFPDSVDVTLVEGAVSSEEDLHKIKMVRRKTTTLISLGDCAVTGNVPSMRNMYKVEDIETRAYVENATENNTPPTQIVPKLLAKVVPVHSVVAVDLFVPGCPPPAKTIQFALTELLAGRVPDLSTVAHFG